VPLNDRVLASALSLLQTNAPYFGAYGDTAAMTKGAAFALDAGDL
jgi:hypothetical protein